MAHTTTPNLGLYKPSTGDPAASWTAGLNGNADTLDAVRVDSLQPGQDITACNATTERHGLLPKLSGNPIEFLNGMGQWITAGVGSGEGDVQGPASNTDSYIPQWNGNNSKVLKDGVALVTTVGVTGSDTAVPTEQAVREALDAINPEGDGRNGLEPTGTAITGSCELPDVNQCYTIDSVSDVTITLPSAGNTEVGDWVSVTVLAATSVVIQAPAGVYLAHDISGGTVTASLTTTLQTVTIRVVATNRWAIVGGTGTWVAEIPT